MQSERRRLEKRIDYLLPLVPQVADHELRAELTKHLCVLSSGLLEASCKETLSRFAEKQCSPTVQRFVSAKLESLRNPKIQSIKDLLSSFDPMKAERWKDSLLDEERDSVDSIVDNRNQIAHGRHVGLSIDVFQRYYMAAMRALEKMEIEFPPN